MIHVLASLHIKEGHLAEFVAIFKANIPNVLEEKGCVEYVPTVDVPTDLPPQNLNRNIVTIVEKWESLDALKAHAASPHMAAYGAMTREMIANRAVHLLSPA